MSEKLPEVNYLKNVKNVQRRSQAGKVLRNFFRRETFAKTQTCVQANNFFEQYVTKHFVSCPPDALLQKEFTNDLISYIKA